MLLLVLLNLFKHVLGYMLDAGQVNCCGIALLRLPLAVACGGNCRRDTLRLQAVILLDQGLLGGLLLNSARPCRQIYLVKVQSDVCALASWANWTGQARHATALRCLLDASTL